MGSIDGSNTRPVTIAGHTSILDKSTRLNTIEGVIRPFIETNSYENYLPFDVVVIDSNNNRVTLASNYRSNIKQNSAFFIKKEYKWETNKVGFNRNGLSSGTTDGSDYQDCFFQMVNDEIIKSGFSGYANGALQVVITEESLNQYNGSVFISELGIVVCLPEVADYIDNPLCVTAMDYEEVEPHLEGLIFKMFAVDPTGVLEHDRYINILDRSYKIPVVKNSRKPPGFYITESIQPVGSSYNDNMVMLTHYTFEEAEKTFHLYSNAREAQNHNDRIKREEEQRIADKQLGITHSKLELEQLTAELKERNLKLQEEATIRKAQLKELEDKIEALSLQRKDRYEAVSHARKDWSEYVKWIPGVIVGVVAAVAACFAIFL